MTLTRQTYMALMGVALAGVALLAPSALRAQLVESLRLGEPRTYRWNEQRTGYSFDPAGGALGFEGLLSAQMPAFLDERRITSGPDSGRTVVVPNPDLQWYFPMDVEGRSIEDAPGNRQPIGYSLDEIHSSPTVGSIEVGGAPVLSVMFGSGGTVRRDIRNTLPPASPDDPTDGRAGFYTANGAYNADRDPYAYLHRERAGAIFGIEAFGGTNEVFAEGDSTLERRYKPLWWYGVRNLPWYRQGEISNDPTGTTDDEFHASPSLLQHRFFINASDTAMRAFDYAPGEARNPEGAFGPEPDDAAQILRRQKLFTQYLAPNLDATNLKGNEDGPGYDGGAGWVGPDRPDIPERVTDRLYNLNILGPRFGLAANSRTILRGGTIVNPVVGPLDNRFRQNNGIGPINSTGLLLRLNNSVKYTSRYYKFRDDSTDTAVVSLQADRRDPNKVEESRGLSTQYLYIVGSDDGYIYALDADPRNARRVPESGGGALTSTYMGRLVWAFRAAVRAPLYTYDSDGTTLTSMNPAPGEGPGGIAGAGTRLGGKNTALVIASGGIVSGPIVSSPVGTVINVPSTPSILTPKLSGQTRSVVYVGSGMGRVFCLDAETGQEIWEFKTTPRGQTRARFKDKDVLIDAVAGYAVNSSPTLGFVPGATSQLRPNESPGRLAVFFSADDGKVYALDAADGSPLRENAATPGWDVGTYVDRGAVVNNRNSDVGTRYRLDHFGFVTYPFERGGKRLPSTTFNGDYPTNGKYGRRRSEYAKPLTASVVARPSRANGYQEPGTGHTIPAVDMLFIASPTNQADATIGDDPAFTGGTLFAVDPANGSAVWTFDRWEDVTRQTNSDFDKEPTKDRFVRPSAFQVTPAFASKTNIFDESRGQNGNTSPRTGVDALFAVDTNGKLYALRTDDGLPSIQRMYWRVPYSLPGNPGQSGGVYSTPVVSTPNQEGDTSSVYANASYVFIGVNDSIVGISTTAPRNDLVLGPDGQPLSGDDKYTGGEMLWGWTTPRDGVQLNDTESPPVFEYVSEPRPVVTTPAIHMGYLWAGADNGLFYAWRNTESGFAYGSSGGGIPYRGGNRQRVPIEDPTQGGGATTGSSTIEFYVDVFEAGFGYFPNFSPNGVKNIRPTGAPLATGSGTGVTPQPVGEKFEEFKGPTGGILEWGDPVAVVAWGPGLEARLATDGDEGRVNFQLSGPNTTGSLQGGLEQDGSQVYSRQIFYLNPFGPFLPPSMRYPGPLAGTQARNPLSGQMLPPGWRGQAFTVRGFYQGPSYTDERGNRRRQAQVPAKVNASTRFHLANPLNISAFFGGTSPTPLVGSGANLTLKQVYEQFPDATRNGNKRVPVVASMVGDHGTSTTSPQTGNLLRVADRSNLNILRARAASWGVPTDWLNNLALRVRIQPQRLRWMGGPQAAYKPLLVRNTANDATGRPALPNGMPLPSLDPPEPMFADDWGSQRASFWDLGGSPYLGAEQPPYMMGEENRSLDYPDIEPAAASWMMLPNVLSSTERDASAVDAPVPDLSLFYLKAAVPKYQPANFSPSNVDPSAAGVSGVGPGYYTVNPANMSAPAASVMGWNPGRSSNGSFYRAYDNPNDTNNEPLYWGPMQSTMPPSASLAAQEPNHLTKVFVDVNGNGTADIASGEAYRMFVSGVQVRPDERLRVATTTISVPNDPETAIPGGFIPFQYYWDGQVRAAGGNSAAGDLFNFGQRNLFAPFDVYNSGNVNMWNVRLSKYDPMGGHLLAPDVDPASYAGADSRSNWPAAGVIKRFNLASTLDPLPIEGSGNPGQGPAGSPNDASLWTPSAKPKPRGAGDEGLGQRMLVKDVFAFRRDAGQPVPERAHGNGILTNPAGRPYLTVAIPPGTTPGLYATEYGRLVVFEDTGPPYANRPYNGILDMQDTTPLEPGVSSDAVVTVRVAESRLTDKVSRYAPFMPQADPGVAMSGSFPSFDPNNAGPNSLGPVWQMLAQDATPSAYRDPRTGHLVTFWSSNRVGYQTGMNVQPVAPFSVTDVASDQYHVFATAMRWEDPVNPPIDPAASVPDFMRNTLMRNPWGWNYQGDNMGSFFFPNFGAASWFGEPTATPWIPSSDTVNAALGLPPGTVKPLDLTYTAPAVITDFHGTEFPPVVFWTGSTGVGPDARSAIFYAPVQVNARTGEVTAGEIQAVGVTGGQRTLDPFATKYGPRPFLITAGGAYEPAGPRLPTSYLNGEKVMGLGVAWFGGAPGAWKMFVSTIETDNSGNATGDGRWSTTQLPLPAGVASAMHPSVYYHQMPKVVPGNDGPRRYGILEVAFTGYSRAGRNPDVYLARYIAARGDANWNDASIGNWQMMGFARQGGRVNDNAAMPLEQMVRVAGEPRPVYRSNWAAWQGRGQLGTTVYWFRKPVSSQGGVTRLDDFQLFATFTARRSGASGVVEARGRRANGGALPDVTAFIDTGGGTVRFATSDPVNSPAPLSRPYVVDGARVQDFIYVAMNPYAMRVTTDDDISDTTPQVWLDETHEVVTDARRTNVEVSATRPLNIRRDRLWVLWRRAAQPEGATRVSSLVFKTFRLGVEVGEAIRLVNGRPDVTVSFRNDDATQVEPFLVNAQTGRLFFTGFNDGDEIRVTANGRNLGDFTIGWIPEDADAPGRYGLGQGPEGTYRLPMGQWVEPRAVPTLEHRDDSQPWIFKDPFSDIPPGAPGYYERGNNNMWLFWSSTRPSRALGAPGAALFDPSYWDPRLNALTYSASASDVYYTTLSPDFAGR